MKITELHRNLMLNGKFPDEIRDADFERIDQLIGLVNTARREGVLALEECAAEMGDKFLKYGVQLIVDGTDPEIVEEFLMNVTLSQTMAPHEYRFRFMTIQGLLDVQAGVNPRLVRMSLLAWFGDQALNNDRYPGERKDFHDLTFNNITDFPQRSIVKILYNLRVGTDHCYHMADFAMSMQGANATIQHHFFSAMTDELKAIIVERMNDFPDLKVSQAQDAQARIMREILGHIRNGSVLDPRDDDKYVNETV